MGKQNVQAKEVYGAIFYEIRIGLVVYQSSGKRILILFQLIVPFTYQFRILKYCFR